MNMKSLNNYQRVYYNGNYTIQEDKIRNERAIPLYQPAYLRYLPKKEQLRKGKQNAINASLSAYQFPPCQ